MLLEREQGRVRTRTRERTKERERKRERERERERDDYRSVSQEIFVLNQEDKERMAALTKKLPTGSSSKPFLEIFFIIETNLFAFLRSIDNKK